MALAVVSSLGVPRRLDTVQEALDFEQEIVDQYLLASLGAGVDDTTIESDRAAIFEFARSLGRPLWTAGPEDADRFLSSQRKLGLAGNTVYGKAGRIGRLFDFMQLRYQGDIHTLTGCAVQQPIDDFNRPSKPDYGQERIPPGDNEVAHLFASWGACLPNARKYLPAARNYMAASLWRRIGLRINESRMLDIRDWRPDLGDHGKLHVRFGKGSRRRGPKPRVVPGINSVDDLMKWWLTDVRHQFGDDWRNPDAPLLPSERRDPHTGMCRRVTDDPLRQGLVGAVKLWLPDWEERLTPHVLRHFCASSFYLSGMDLKAIQEILGHEWLSTTTRYIHVRSDHIESAWATANDRVSARLLGERK